MVRRVGLAAILGRVGSDNFPSFAGLGSLLPVTRDWGRSIQPDGAGPCSGGFASGHGLNRQRSWPDALPGDGGNEGEFRDAIVR
jgi:hypothetical protein